MLSKKKRIDSLSIAITGCVIPAKSSRIFEDTRRGMIRIHNESDKPHSLPGSRIRRRELDSSLPRIKEDDDRACKPLAWGQPFFKVEILGMPTDLCENGTRALSDANFKRLTRPGSKYRMEEIIGSVPAIPGSEANQNTMRNYLGFRRTLWRLCKEDIRSETDHPCVCLETGAFLPNGYKVPAGTNKEIYVLPDALSGKTLGIVVPVCRVPQVEPVQSELDEYLKKVGSCGIVSLLQKIVRKMPCALRHPESGNMYPAIGVINAVVDRMLAPSQPGIFLPDFGVYISALQHMLKRAFIIMAEDSEYNESVMIRFSGAALLVSRAPAWRPDAVLRNLWTSDLIDMWKSGAWSSFRTVGTLNSPLGKETFPYEVLKQLGGMKGDMRMLQYLAANPNSIKSGKVPDGAESLDILFDQHMNGSLCYLLVDRRPYPKVLSDVFKQVSGFNPRKHKSNVSRPDVLDAMAELSRMVRRVGIPNRPEGDKTLTWDLPLGSLAGMLGPLTVKMSSGTFFVTVDPDDLKNFVVIPKPSRNSSLDSLAPADRKTAIRIAQTRFSKGVVLQVPMHPKFKGKKARYDKKTGEWHVDSEPWSSIGRQVKYQVCKDDVTMVHHVQEYPWQRHQKLAETFSEPALRWVYGRLGGFEMEVSVPRASRNGTGTKEALCGQEGEGFRILSALAQENPDALWPNPRKPFAFVTHCLPLRHRLRTKLLQSIQTSNASFPRLSDHRQLRPQQKDALEELIRKDRKGLGNFLWMLVGSGKTLTVLHFLDKTRRTTSVLWCLPKSATKTVCSDIRKGGWKVRVLVSTKHRKKASRTWVDRPQDVVLERKLIPGIVTIVEHDDLRNLAADLAPYMPTTSLVFDEVHKSLAPKTKRTAASLGLARLSPQLVAMTGTPVLNSKAYPLLQWLKLCVPFQVNGRNFWVSANTMVAKLSKTPVHVRESVQEVKGSSLEEAEIKKLLPRRLGGTAIRPNWRAAYNLSQKVCSVALVELTWNICYGPRTKAPTGTPDRDLYQDDHTYAVACTRTMEPSVDLFNHLNQRVLLVSENRRHAVQMANALLIRGVPASDLFVVGGTRSKELKAKIRHRGSVCITRQSVEHPKPKICVIPLQFCEGYSLTWMTTIVTGVYPSNLAKRTQMAGRINRVNCERLHRHIITLTAGITTVMHKYHNDAKTLQQALAQLARQHD